MEHGLPKLNGDAVAQAREQMELSVATVAQALGLSVADLNAIEAGDAELLPPWSMALLYMVEHPEARPRRELRAYNPGEIELFGDQLRDGKQWGPWRFSLESMTLDFNSRLVPADRDVDGNVIEERTEDYYIDLDRAMNAEEVLDWLGQIANKGWGPSAIGYLVLAFDEVLGFQGKLAHGKPFTSVEQLYSELRRRAAQPA